MTRYFSMHSVNPQPRLIKEVVQALVQGELIAYPTDSTYALGCALSSRKSLEHIRKLRDLDEKHPLTLICHSISQASHYCILDDKAFQIFKRFTPGPYTFILPTTNQVPRPAQGIKRKVVGIRIPSHPVALALVEELGEPILSTTLWLKDDEEPISDPQEIIKKTRGLVDIVLDAGLTAILPTTVVDLSGDHPVVIRRGLGDPDAFESL